MSIFDFFSTQGELNRAALMRRILFFILMIGLVTFYLFIDFRGLSHPMGMDQAQIGREIAKGNGYTTQCVRPIALHDMQAHGKEDISLAQFPDTYHAPLNPILNALTLKLIRSQWGKISPSDSIYFCDRALAFTSILLFLISIGIFYLLLAKIFDTKIAGVTALLLLFCDLLWRFSLSGLPQMLMLFLFALTLLFIYKAIEKAQQELSPTLWVLLAGGTLALLTLTHWTSCWIFIGYVIYVAFFFRPRGLLALILIGLFILIISPWLIRVWMLNGNPFGTAFHTLHGGLAAGSEDFVMRNVNFEKEPYSRDGLGVSMINNSILQLDSLYVFLGSILVAPLFFLSLLHPFKRQEIASFRWCIFFMWIPAVFGMSLFGLEGDKLSPNQLHILFAPIMAAYGLAFVSIMWNRLPLPMHLPLISNGHFILITLLSAAPLLLNLPRDVIYGMRTKYKFHTPYYPAVIQYLSQYTKDKEVIVSDIPWAVAWYADQISLWLPQTPEQLDHIAQKTTRNKNPIAGVHISLYSANKNLWSDLIFGEYKAWKNIITQGAYRSILGKNADITFPYPKNFKYTRPISFYRESPQMLFFVEPARVKEKP